MSNEQLKTKLKVKNIGGLVNAHHMTGDYERDECTKWMRSLDIKYHLTLTFNYGSRESHCIEQLNKFFHYLNLKIYKDRYSKYKKIFIDGLVIMEDTPSMDSVHFHVLILDESHLPNEVRMNELLQSKMLACNRNCKTLIKYHLLQEYYSSTESSLEKYLTKNFESLDKVNAWNRIGTLSVNGVHFGGLDSLSKMGDYYSSAFYRPTAA